MDITVPPFASHALDRRRLLKTAGIAAAAVGLPLSRLEAGSNSDLTARIGSLVEGERRAANLSGLGAAVVTSQGPAALAVSGVRVWPDGPRIGRNDRWHLGSCTKAFTATLVARLIEQRRLSWNSTIGQVLKIDMALAWRDVPLLWLLCHRSGASMNFDQEIWERMVARGGALIDQRRYFVREGLQRPPELPPGSATIYSNAGFMVAGAMIEQATGIPWETLIRRKVFTRLGMDNSGFGPPNAPGRADQPQGHNRGDGGSWQPAPDDSSADNPAATGPAGTVHCTLADWARFIAAHLQGFKGRGSYLSRTSWERFRTPAAADWDYCPGWKVDRTAPASDPVLQHLGSNGYWLAQATLYPARDRAVLLVCNLADDAAEPVFGRLLAALSS